MKKKVECWDEWSTGILCVSFLHVLFYISLYSLEWDKYQWTRIRDEGVIALADPRLIKNFKILK